jgi:hypothetical protein
MTRAEEIQRIVSASVRDMLDAYRIQASAGSVTRQGARGDHLPSVTRVLRSLVNYPGLKGSRCYPASCASC